VAREGQVPLALFFKEAKETRTQRANAVELRTHRLFGFADLPFIHSFFANSRL
jgi:hypothetical protein